MVTRTFCPGVAWARAKAWGLEGGQEDEETKNRRNRENCPVWILRTSVPLGPMPKSKIGDCWKACRTSFLMRSTPAL